MILEIVTRTHKKSDEVNMQLHWEKSFPQYIDQTSRDIHQSKNFKLLSSNIVKGQARIVFKDIYSKVTYTRYVKEVRS